MAAIISAKAAGPPQWQAAPPLTACTSISATNARVARGSASTTGWPAEFFTVREYFGGRVGVPASLDLMGSGLSGGASSGFTTEVSAAIKFHRIWLFKYERRNVRGACQKGRRNFRDGV